LGGGLQSEGTNKKTRLSKKTRRSWEKCEEKGRKEFLNYGPLEKGNNLLKEENETAWINL